VILLDSHVFLALAGLTELELPAEMLAAIENDEERFISVATLWELAIKYQLGKLKIGCEPSELIAVLVDLKVQILDINQQHAFAGPKMNVPTKDPFDRLLLGVCKVEKMKLMTLDQALMDHPLAWKPKRRRSAK
jgi:PIN domain nuclease of toxin-antitoxin system